MSRLPDVVRGSAMRFAVGLAAAFLAVGVMAAQSAGRYPERPLTMMVSYSPAGATDYQARLVTMVAEHEEYLGQPIVILNKAGKGGQIGWSWLATEAPSDGYTLAAYNVPHFIAQSIMFNTKYNIRNLEPIANWGADPAVFIVSHNSPFKSVEDLMEFARVNPKKVTVSGAGLYVGHHIAMLQLEKAAKVKLKYFAAKGGVGALNAVISGEATAGFNNLSDTYRNKDKVRILAIADLMRDKAFMPEVPTFKELGFDIDDSSVNFRGIMVRANTPPQVVGYLAERIPKMFRDKQVSEKMLKGGAAQRVLGRQEVMRMWREREKALKELLAEYKDAAPEK